MKFSKKEMAARLKAFRADFKAIRDARAKREKRAERREYERTISLCACKDGGPLCVACCTAADNGDGRAPRQSA